MLKEVIEIKNQNRESSCHNSLALVVSTEMQSPRKQTGKNPSMLLTNYVFRKEGAAILCLADINTRRDWS